MPGNLETLQQKVHITGEKTGVDIRKVENTKKSTWKEKIKGKLKESIQQRRMKDEIQKLTSERQKSVLKNTKKIQ